LAQHIPPRFAREYAHLFSAMIEARARTPPRCVARQFPLEAHTYHIDAGQLAAFSRASTKA